MYIFVKEIMKDVIKHKLEYFIAKWFGEEKLQPVMTCILWKWLINVE